MTTFPLLTLMKIKPVYIFLGAAVLVFSYIAD